LTAEALGNGTPMLSLNVPPHMRQDSTAYQSNKERMSKSSILSHGWRISTPEDGYYFVEATISFEGDKNPQTALNPLPGEAQIRLKTMPYMGLL